MTGCFATMLGFAAVAVFAAAGSPAYALESCTGQYSAALLRPLAQPPVVALDLSDSSGVAANLAASFSKGMQQAGVVMIGTPTIRLRLSYQIAGQEGSTPPGSGLNQGGGGSTGWSTWSGGSAAALQGGQTMALPDFPNYDAFSPQQPVQSALLMFRVEARNVGVDAPNWVAWMQCTLQGADNQTLAYQLGYLIGGAFGKERENAPV